MIGVYLFDLRVFLCYSCKDDFDDYVAINKNLQRMNMLQNFVLNVIIFFVFGHLFTSCFFYGLFYFSYLFHSHNDNINNTILFTENISDNSSDDDEVKLTDLMGNKNNRNNRLIIMLYFLNVY